MSKADDQQHQEHDREFFSYIAEGREQRARRVRRGSRWALIGAGGLFVLAIAFAVGSSLDASSDEWSPEATQCASTVNAEIETVWNEFIDNTSIDTDAEFLAFIDQRTADFAQRYPENTGEYAAFYYAFQKIESAAAQGTLDQPGKTKEELAAEAMAEQCRAHYPN